MDAETSSGTYTPFASSQTAVPELEPPFPFDSCKGATPDGTHVNHTLVKDGWCWWYRKYAPADRVLEGLEAEAREAKKGLWAVELCSKKVLQYSSSDCFWTSLLAL
jgi:Staphylococcal nuclease homologue